MLHVCTCALFTESINGARLRGTSDGAAWACIWTAWSIGCTWRSLNWEREIHVLFLPRFVEDTPQSEAASLLPRRAEARDQAPDEEDKEQCEEGFGDAGAFSARITKVE
jgi:hypothetical protein